MNHLENLYRAIAGKLGIKLEAARKVTRMPSSFNYGQGTSIKKPARVRQHIGLRGQLVGHGRPKGVVGYQHTYGM